MKLELLESKKEKWQLEIEGEDHTLLNLLREKSWDEGAKQSSYMIKHPYLSKPVITVIGANPKKILADAAQSIINDAQSFGKEFKRVSK